MPAPSIKAFLSTLSELAAADEAAAKAEADRMAKEKAAKAENSHPSEGQSKGRYGGKKNGQFPLVDDKS